MIDPLPIDSGVSEPGDVVSGSSGSSDGATEPGDVGDAEPAPPPEPDLPMDDDGEIASDDPIEPIEADGDAVSDSSFEYLFYRPRVQVTVVDISDRSAPTVLSRTTFEGRTVSSRMIDRRLHLVIANHPEFFYDVLPLGQPEPVYDDIDLDDLLPDFVSEDADGQKVAGSIVGWQRFYRPADPDGFGVTSIISMDVDDAAGFEAVGVVAQPALIYASREALYLTDMDYTWWGAARETTDIYKFSFTDTGVELTAAGTVPGRIADQYHMGEHSGDLRVASSTFPRFNRVTGVFEESGNHVYVLRNVDGSLEIVGRVENIAPGEDLKAVRFMGDRAIIVTFRQTDPFFTIDLSDPTAPRVAGEVEVPGFSTFMVPMDDDHMLTIGHYVPLEGWGVPDGIQLSIFDISDFANPVRSHNVIVAGQSTSSEAVWNPKAFTYFPDRDLLALPMEIYNYDFWWEEWDFAIAVDGVPVADADVASVAPITEESDFVGLYVYRVTAEDGFEHLGRIATQNAEMYYNTNRFTRGVFIGDNVYAVTDRTIIGAPVEAIESVPFSVELSDESDDVDGASLPPIMEGPVLPD
ncbi:MAG: beta-propeller domain-containing protein [Planctomycetes bacterium]|nr:beta-propeller domain-containing protein [Planctomycetota bacterium]